MHSYTLEDARHDQGFFNDKKFTTLYLKRDIRL